MPLPVGDDFIVLEDPGGTLFCVVQKAAVPRADGLGTPIEVSSDGPRSRRSPPGSSGRHTTATLSAV